MATDMMSMSSTDLFAYDVFLSFRGEDTRRNFTDHLYHNLFRKGIHVFLGDAYLERGDKISQSLMNAIENSRNAIVILSENYASSTWCLEELSHILNCIKDKGRSVWPVYYGIDPTDVRNQTGPYANAFAKHEKNLKVNMDKMDKWKNALTQLSNLPGWDIRDQPESISIDKIVKEVVSKTWLFGLESPKQEVLSLLELESESDEVLMIGIYGATGIGKTTLATEIYNKIENQFQASCFLPNVRESSIQNGLVHLQNKLLTELLGEKDNNITNVDIGASLIGNRLHTKKVLLILDDVDKLEQLEALVGKPDWFGPGSRVIITTRDKHLLTFRGVERIHEVQLLNPEDALKLLSCHIFKQRKIDSSCIHILKELVSYASGLPLALIVIGSYLYSKGVEQWPDVLNMFKKIPPQEIQNKLQTSFDALRKDEKSIFLDIACCFQGYKLVEALKILCAHHGGDVKPHIDVLKDKSLVSISTDDMVALHPLIMAMGKEIVRKEDQKEPGKRSRLWFPEDIVEVLKNNTGTNNIEIIHLDSPLIEDEEAVEWDGNAFKKMENLRTLIIRKGHFSKAPKYLPRSLRVLEWWRYPSQNLPYGFNPNQFVRLFIDKLPIKDNKSPTLFELTNIASVVSRISQRIVEVLHNLPSVLEVSHSLKILQRDDKNIKTWRVVGFVSSIIGLSSFALSPSSNHLIRGWKPWKFYLYGVFSLILLIGVLFVKQSSLFTQYVRLKITSFLLLLLLSLYTFYYDKAVNGKPEILCLVSNTAFALVSISFSKLMVYGSEKGLFNFFLNCLVVQLWTINWMLIFVAIIISGAFFYMHSLEEPKPLSSDSRQEQHLSTDTEEEVISEGQGVHSSIDTRQEVISESQSVHSSTDTDTIQEVLGECEGQCVHSSIDTRQEVISEGQGVDFSTDTRQEVTSDGQVVHSSKDTGQEVISECQGVHSSTDTGQEVISEGQGVHSSTDTGEHQYVIDMEQVNEGQVVDSLTDTKQQVISEGRGVHSSTDTREDQHFINMDEN